MTSAARELVTTERLREFFAPRSIALVGASDNSGWARLIVASCKIAGFGGPLTPGPVGVALQSGALASVVLAFAKAHAIGLSVLTSMGNEAMMKTADVLDYLVEDEATKVICLFLEEIGDPVAFAAVAAKADRAGKPIVALKVGSSPAGQQAAMAHTGPVAGDDAVVDAVLPH